MGIKGGPYSRFLVFTILIRFLQKGILNKWKLVELKSGSAPDTIGMNDLDLKLKKSNFKFQPLNIKNK